MEGADDLAEPADCVAGRDDRKGRQAGYGIPIAIGIGGFFARPVGNEG